MSPRHRRSELGATPRHVSKGFCAARRARQGQHQIDRDEIQPSDTDPLGTTEQGSERTGRAVAVELDNLKIDSIRTHFTVLFPTIKPIQILDIEWMTVISKSIPPNQGLSNYRLATRDKASV